MNKKRLAAALLLCAALLTTALPVFAAPSSFSDVSDPATGANAEVLRLMGVVSGSGGNNFSPDAQLTRAQFCVMAVQVMGRGGDVPIHTTRTIFADVTSRHWARGYVNLAASISVGTEESGGRLISGMGTGQFLPDDPITFAQTVTILMRALGYTDDRAGAVWPAGYLNLASSVGLTQGVWAQANDPITRAQAARLFVNLLSCKTTQGQKFCATLGSVTENVLLLAVNVTGDDGRPGAIRTSHGVYHPAVEGVSPTGLVGRRGTLVLNDRKELVSFLPDQSATVTVTLAEDAQAAYLKSSGGTRYSIDADTPAFTGSTEEGDSTYSKLWMDLRAGAQITLFLDGGKVIGLYCPAMGQTITQAMVVEGELNRASFRPITGGVEDYTIKKNGQVIHLEDVRPNDVATYDPVTNTVVVSDLRLTCVYESALPNPATPSTIHALGHDFTVLESAVDSVSRFSVGKLVTLLLTADGQVAGMAQSGTNARSTAMGLAGTDSVEMFLPNGGSIELKSTQPLSENVKNQLVTISSSQAGVVKGTRLSGRTAAQDLDLEKMTLGSYPVAQGVRVFERAGNSAPVRIILSDLDAKTISKEEIALFHLNSSNMVDLVVLNDAIGDSYRYGQYVVESTWTKEYQYDENGDLVLDSSGQPVYEYSEQRSLSFQNGDGMVQLPNVGFIGDSGTYVGVALDGKGQLRARVYLTAVEGVSRSDFFTSQGRDYVEVNGKVYEVSDQLHAFNNANKTWFTGEDILSAVRAYSNDMTLYVDPIGHKVRVIAVD